MKTSQWIATLLISVSATAMLVYLATGSNASGLTPVVVHTKPHSAPIDVAAGSTPGSGEIVEYNPADWPLAIDLFKTKSPPNRPSKGVADLSPEEQKKLEQKRTIYGGKGDPEHLGGFTSRDGAGISPVLWNWLVKVMTIKSVIDVGCGKGVSSKWFLDHNVDAMCVEGSHDAITQRLMPIERVVEHDFSQGPWWPDRTYDMVWSVEFLEHVGLQYMQNYLPIFKKAAYVFATHSTWGGWHHVEVHNQWWWVAKMESAGLKFSQELTDLVKKIAHTKEPGGDYNAQHIVSNMMVFVNPAVTRLPEHQHLVGGPGCFRNYAKDWNAAKNKDKTIWRSTESFGNDHLLADCLGADAVPENYLPVDREPSKLDAPQFMKED